MSEQPEQLQVAEIDELTARSVVEALLFSAEEPLTGAKIRDAIPELAPYNLQHLVEALNTAYEESGRTFEIQQVAGGYMMFTRPDYAEYLHRMHARRNLTRLSAKALETLAIIAYKQPLTRNEIEEIRGVNADGVIRTLLSRNLITIAGIEETPGNPYLYKTTRQFLEYFGLQDLKRLPRLKELDEIVQADAEIKEKFGEAFLKDIAPEILGMKDHGDIETLESE